MPGDPRSGTNEGMIRRRPGAVLVIVPLVAALAGCGSDVISGNPAPLSSVPSTSDTASPGSSTPGSSTPGSSAPGSSTPAPVPSGVDPAATELVARVRAALGRISTTTFSLVATAAGGQVRGGGKQQLDGDTVKALDVSQDLGGSAIRIIVVGDRAWVRSPLLSGSASKPYVLVSATSKDPVIVQLAASLRQTLSQSSVRTSIDYLTGTRQLKDAGKADVGGVATTHYTLSVDPSLLPASSPLGKQLREAGFSSLDVELYLDGDDRPVRVTSAGTAKGQQVRTDFTVTGFDVPVSITPPPADQVVVK